MKSKTDYAEPLIEESTVTLSRWQLRKQKVLLEQQQDDLEKEKLLEPVEEEVLLTDEDMPAIDTLTDESDYTGFLSPKVSESLRKLALRKLFHGAEFNIRDGLDEYDGDYTKFEALGDLVTSDMKHQIEMEAQRKLEEAKNKLMDDEEDAAKINPELENDDLKTETVVEASIEQNSETDNEQHEIYDDDEVIG